jgi:regulator of protease activity HflC (stomatin/prohibitin superfamily)
MIDKLIDTLIAIWDSVKFWEIVMHYERGVRLRRGVFKELLEPGWHWKIPVIDHMLTDNVVTRTNNLSPQALQTSDGKTVQVSAILRFNIRDIYKALLEVEGIDHATRDIGYLVIAEAVQTHPYEAVRSADFADVMTKAARKIGWRYGIEVEQLGLSDVSPAKTLILVKPNG